MRRCLPLLLFALLAPASLFAADQAFDLAGPKVDVHVKRGEVTLPIGEVPNLLPGDRLWIHPDLPESQSIHFVLVVAFLRGATNSPPPDWYTRVETWNHTVREEGVFVTVPDEAQQALIFLAPETGGDFSTLRKAVHDRPGAFVRATQDLQAASWDRMRLDAYLAEVKVTTQTDPAQLKEHAEKAARSLGIRLDQQCFDKPTDQQAPCLTQHTDGLVLDDANAQSLVEQLANGATGDLMNQLSYSTPAGGGMYSPYVGAILDTVRILSSLHTAHFQYIPALALPTKDTLNLRLNVPPSFRDPRSVVVVALPPIGPAVPPPLHPAIANETFCAPKPGMALTADGAPLVYATRLAYDLHLHIETGSSPIDLPVTAAPSAGGLVFEHAPAAIPGGNWTAVLRGKWGFDNWEGPRFHLFVPQPGGWALAPADSSALVVGREDTLHFAGASTVCVDRMEKLEKLEKASAGADPAVKLAWKAPKPDAIEVAVPMKDATPGPVSLEIHQFGLAKPDTIALQAYAEAASLEGLTLSAGDSSAQLRGTRLDEVEKVSIDGIAFTPAALHRVEGSDHLAMTTHDSTLGLTPGKPYSASVKLRDGRLLKAPATVDPARPQVTLLSKGVQDDAAEPPSPVHLGSPDDLPLAGQLVFFLKSKLPANFPRDETVEVAAVDGSFHTVLSLADSSLVLEDADTALGVIDPQARFGSSAFGPLHARVLSADGAGGDWFPLGTLVRLPGFKDLRCPRAQAKPCTLTGSNLFLATSIASTPDFDNPSDVPPEFTGTQLTVPHPANGVLYLKLRDDPATVQTVTLPVTPMTSAEATQSASAPTATPAPTAATAPQPPTPTQPATPQR
jgi:hypothetical protein